MPIPKRTNKFYDTERFESPQIRVFHKKGKQKHSPRYLLKCGCCDSKVEIYYSDDGLEVNGVNGALDDWREILFPLLKIEKKGNKYIDKIKK